MAGIRQVGLLILVAGAAATGGCEGFRETTSPDGAADAAVTADATGRDVRPRDDRGAAFDVSGDGTSLADRGPADLNADGPDTDGPLPDGPLPDGPLPDGSLADGPLPDGPVGDAAADLDPKLSVPPAENRPCTKIDGYGECKTAEVCRPFNSVEGRCEGCTACKHLGDYCNTGDDCDIVFVCYANRCTNPCWLSGGCEPYCKDVGHETHGVCLAP